MAKRNTISVKRTAPPALVFIAIYICFIILPTAYIAFSDYYSNYWFNLSYLQYRYSANLALSIALLFFFAFLLGYSFFKSLSKKDKNNIRVSGKKNKIFKVIVPAIGDNKIYYRLSKHRFFYYIAWVSIALVWIYTAFGGYEKIALFGQNISKLDYRLIGFNEDRILTAFLQIARRLTLPFCAIYFILIGFYSRKYNIAFLGLLIISFLTGIVVTLDRGPFMLFLVMFAYIYYCLASNAAKVFLNGFILLIAMFLLGGVLSFIQHNIQDFSFAEVVVTGNEFLVNRALMAPNFVPIELSYGQFDTDTPKLWLKYARITALFTGEYVGTLEANSIFVGPVGAVADIWRNTGFIGIVLIGLGLGAYFYKLEKLLEVSDPIIQVAGTFTVITLIFYFIYGTFFSQGVFLQLIFLFIILKFSLVDGKTYQL